MKKNKIVAAIMSLIMTSASMPFYANAQDTVTHTITFLDFDGNVMTRLKVEDGKKINYSKVDTSSLDKHIDNYTERSFYKWSETPDTITSDITVQALSQTYTLSIKEAPIVRRYVYMDDPLTLEGLNVEIVKENQIAERDENGEYKTESTVENIGGSCYCKPDSLEAAFSGAEDIDSYGTKSADVTVYTRNNQELFTYKIYYVPKFGDVTHNNRYDVTDATYMLKVCSNLSNPNINIDVSDDLFMYGDVDGNRRITTYDATCILKFCAMIASRQNAPDWRKIVKVK
jgi:S-adenosylmethionine hydrolase